MSRLREALSDEQHAIWAHWMAYVFQVCPRQADGSVTIPRELVERWTRQIATPYAALSESEKDSDREQADRILDVLEKQVSSVQSPARRLRKQSHGRA
jgi:hypothetical protein